MAGRAKCSTWPIISVTPWRSAAAMMAEHSSVLRAMGFSSNTCLPAPAAAIAISLIAIVTGRRAALPWVALLLTAVFAVGSALAFYHVGVEKHWFAGPTACTGAATAANTVEALKARILGQMPVRCDEPAWMLWGVSLAGWNLVASLLMGGGCLAVLRLLRGPRQAEMQRETA